jgi:hypothetical protein
MEVIKSHYLIFFSIVKLTSFITNRTPGHPESHDTEGIEVTTGPLGQGKFIIFYFIQGGFDTRLLSIRYCQRCWFGCCRSPFRCHLQQARL